MRFFTKLKGDAAPIPPRPPLATIAISMLGCFMAAGLLTLMADQVESAMLLGSFGASCLLLFSYPDAPFSQPRNVLFGHLASSAIGLAFMAVLGSHWWSVSLAVATSVGLMMFLRMVHPPAGANPVIIYLSHPSWSFLLMPTLAGAMLLIAVALIYNNLARKANYPKYW